MISFECQDLDLMGLSVTVSDNPIAKEAAINALPMLLLGVEKEKVLSSDVSIHDKLTYIAEHSRSLQHLLDVLENSKINVEDGGRFVNIRQYMGVRFADDHELDIIYVKFGDLITIETNYEAVMKFRGLVLGSMGRLGSVMLELSDRRPPLKSFVKAYRDLIDEVRASMIL